DDASVLHQAGDLSLVVRRDLLRIESIECYAIGVALTEDRFPAQARLSAFEDEELKQPPILMHRHAPLFVVVGDHQIGRGPEASAGRSRHYQSHSISERLN